MPLTVHRRCDDRRLLTVVIWIAAGLLALRLRPASGSGRRADPNRILRRRRLIGTRLGSLVRLIRPDSLRVRNLLRVSRTTNRTYHECPAYRQPAFIR